MDRGQARTRRQQRGRGFCKRGRQQCCHRFAVTAGVLEEGRERPQADKFASIDGMRAEVQQLRAIRVSAGGGDAVGG